MSNEKDSHLRPNTTVRHGGNDWLLIFVGFEMGQSQTVSIAGQQQERAAMFIQQYPTFKEAGLIYYEVTINKDLEPLSVEEAGAAQMQRNELLSEAAVCLSG